MIRKPAIEIINYIKNMDFSRPVYKFVLCNVLIFNLIIRLYV